MSTKILTKHLSKLFILTVLCLSLFSCKNDEPTEPEFDPESVPAVERMIIAVSVTVGEPAVKLPLDGTVDCYINWGDGEWEKVSAPYPAHTYAGEGTHLVTIVGTVTSLYAAELSNYERLRITGVVNWGKTGLTRMNSAFEGCAELAFLPDDDEGSFADVESFNDAFAGCSSLAKIPEWLFFNCKKVNSFSGVFSGCSSITEIPAGLFRNGLQINSFDSTFEDCKNLAAIPAGLFDDCKNANNFSFTFRNCENLTEIPAGLFDNCKMITGLLLTFGGCKNLAGESPHTIVDGNKIHLYERDGETGGFAKPGDFFLCFYECTGLSDFADMPDGWK